MTTNANTTPVLIAGAGPSGLVLALTLLKNGVPVRIIEKAQQYNVGQRGPGHMPRSLELHNFLGVLPDVLKIGRPAPDMRFYGPDGVTPARTFNMAPHKEPTPAIPYINPILIGQENYEGILRSHLAKLNCSVELGTELRSFEQFPDHVVAHVVKLEGEKEVPETINASWLVGTDGAKGVTRKLLGLTFLGETRESDRIAIVDMEVFGIDRDHWHMWGDMNTHMVSIRPTELDNNYFSVLAGSRTIDPATLIADKEELFKYIRKVTSRENLTFGDIRWSTVYRPNIRMVDKFGEGRVFVAGDAAHAHAPTGAQGLNSSIQDAVNLGWKLALVHKSLAPASLLATYTDERLPVIAEMLKTSTELLNKRVGARQGDVSSWERDTPIFQLGVNYRWSAIVRDEFAPAAATDARDPYGVEHLRSDRVRAGDRAPDAPALVDATSAATSLFQVFGPAYHTVLIFSPDAALLQPVVQTLQRYPKGTVRVVAVLPESHDVAAIPEIPGVDLAVVDKEGHAYRGYHVAKESLTVVIVRPDGVVGAMLKGAEGVDKYFGGIFSV